MCKIARKFAGGRKTGVEGQKEKNIFDKRRPQAVYSKLRHTRDAIMFDYSVSMLLAQFCSKLLEKGGISTYLIEKFMNFVLKYKNNTKYFSI